MYFCSRLIKATTLKLSELQQLFETHKNIPATVDILPRYKNIFIKGLQGSSDALFAASLFNKTNDSFLYVLNDLESAGYFYHDLGQILGNNRVFFFPSAYKRAVKYGQIDSASEILRTEVLGKLQAEDKHFIIVTFPDALAEKVASQESLEKNTLQLYTGQEIDRQFIDEVLLSFEFEYVDYVYEPGQYAIRGSIIDVFSFSSEYPYRIDFFGDEISTIRTFEVDTQLSKEKLQNIQIIPDMQRMDMDRESLLALLPENTVAGFKDLRWVTERIDAVYTDKPLLDNPEYMADFQNKLIDKEQFSEKIDKFRQLHIGARPVFGVIQ